MDFIPNISKKVRPKRSATISKLSLKSRNKNLTQSQSSIDIVVDSQSTMETNYSFSQPVPEVQGIKDDSQPSVLYDTEKNNSSPNKKLSSTKLLETINENSLSLRTEPSKVATDEELICSEGSNNDPVNAVTKSSDSDSSDIAIIDIIPMKQEKNEFTTNKDAVKPSLNKLLGLVRKNSEPSIGKLEENSRAFLNENSNEASTSRGPSIESIHGPLIESHNEASTSRGPSIEKIHVPLIESHNQASTSRGPSIENILTSSDEQNEPSTSGVSEETALASFVKHNTESLGASKISQAIADSSTGVNYEVYKAKFAAKLQVFSKIEPKQFSLDQPFPANQALDDKDTKINFSEDIDSTTDVERSVAAAPKEPVVVQRALELPCPVCCKPAGKNRRAHMKACAAKNSVSTIQLMEAIDLQEKQASERRALGLPEFNTLNQKSGTKKKSNQSGSKDASVQLALALSKSLMEAQEQEELKQVNEIYGTENMFEWYATPSQIEMSAKVMEEHSANNEAKQLVLSTGSDGTVQLKKPTNPVRRNKAGKMQPTALIRTTQEERERRVTEKVAMLLLSEDNGNNAVETSKVPPISNKLEKKACQSSSLWDMAAISSNSKKDSFYVEKLAEFISPTKHEPGAALKHLSQIPGRKKTPMKNSEQGTKKSASKSPKDAVKSCGSGASCRDRLVKDWAGLLNSRTMSDVSVYVRGDVELKAHKLVLFVRCAPMLKDIAQDLSPGSGKVREEMLLWSDVSKAAALAMLEFLYCGTTERACILTSTDLEELKQLSKRYGVNELFQHLTMLERIRCGASKTPETPIYSKKLSRGSNASPVAEKSADPATISLTSSSDNSDSESSVKLDRPDIDFLVSMMEKSQYNAGSLAANSPSMSPVVADSKENSSQSPHTDRKSSPNSPCLVENKRKYSTSSDETKPKKICNITTPIRKSLTFESPEKSPLSSEKKYSSNEFLNLLENSPLHKSQASSEHSVVRSEVTPPHINSVWDNFEDCGYVPIASPKTNRCFDGDSTSTPEVILKELDNSSSKKSLRRSLDDSLSVFRDVDLSGLERAALSAYNKVVSPIKATPGASTPKNRPEANNVTPLPDYSIMESPQLEKELDKYGIRKLKKRQAKLILRHIYNELHPLVPVTPVAASKRTDSKAPRDRRGGKAASSGVPRKAHDISLSQPTRGQPKSSAPLSSTQPVSHACTSSFSESSSNSEDSSEEESYEFLQPEVGTAGKLLESTQCVSDAMDRILACEPEFHQKLLMYEPVMLADVQNLLKLHGYRCKPNLLLDYLDEHCITFRTPRPPRQQKKRSPRKAGTQSRGRKKKAA